MTTNKLGAKHFLERGEFSPLSKAGVLTPGRAIIEIYGNFWKRSEMLQITLNLDYGLAGRDESLPWKAVRTPKSASLL